MKLVGKAIFGLLFSFIFIFYFKVLLSYGMFVHRGNDC